MQDIKKLNQFDRNFLESAWLNDFLVTGKKDNVDRWYESVLYLLSHRGDEVIPAIVIDIERQIIQGGMSGAYLDELVSRIPQALADSVDDASLSLLVLTLGADDRIKAIKQVLKNNPHGVIHANDEFEKLG